MWLALLFASATAQPQAILDTGVSGLQAQVQVQSDQLKRHRDETYLVHKRVEPQLLRNLLVWSPGTGEWAAPKPEEEPGAGARIRIIHLWADYCTPCEREFPWLRAIVQKANAKYKGKVRYLFVAESTASESMRAYLASHKDRMPDGPHYQDTQGQLLEALRPGIPSGSVSLPATLLLDEQGIIRHALVGPLAEPVDRRPELVSAIERLMALSEPR